MSQNIHCTTFDLCIHLIALYHYVCYSDFCLSSCKFNFGFVCPSILIAVLIFLANLPLSLFLPILSFINYVRKMFNN
jgi:hypothetical protein